MEAYIGYDEEAQDEAMEISEQDRALARAIIPATPAKPTLDLVESHSSASLGQILENKSTS